MMDTLAIYEQFRAVLGEDRAKVFAQTLGTMIEEAKNAATKDDIRQLRDSLEASTARLETRLDRLEAVVVKLAEAQLRTEARVDQLAEAQIQTEGRLTRLEETVAKLAEAQVRTEARLDKLAEAQVQTDARLTRLEETVAKLAEAQVRTEARLTRLEETVAKLAEAQVRTEARLERLEAAVEKLVVITEKLVIRTDRHEGQLLELLFRDRLPSYLGLFLRRAKVLQTSDLLDDIEPRLDRAEIEDFLRADVLARGTIDGAPTYVVGEISYTADGDDVERAARRAALLRKADLPALGLVACGIIPPQTLAYAREQGVRVWADGRLLDERPATP